MSRLPDEIINHILSFIRPIHPIAQLIKEQRTKYNTNLPLFFHLLNIDNRPYSLRTRIKYVLDGFYWRYERIMENWTFSRLEREIKAYEKRMPKAEYHRYLEEYQFWLEKEKKQAPVIREMKKIRRYYLTRKLNIFI